MYTTCSNFSNNRMHESFRNTILDQPLWSNSFINVQKRGKKNIMLLRNWIRSGVRYIKDLSFVNGIVDRRVCNAIVDKQNIHIEYSCIRKALLPYANDIIRAQNQNSNTTYEPKVLKAKSKSCYKDFICNKAFNLTVVSSNLYPYCIRNQIDERTVFTTRICCEKEKKLKELNFKMVHGILSCGANYTSEKLEIAVFVMYVTKIKQLFICFLNTNMWKDYGLVLEKL